MATTTAIALVVLSMISIINPSEPAEAPKGPQTIWPCMQGTNAMNVSVLCTYRGDKNEGFKCMISQLSKDDPVYKLCAPVKDQDHVCSKKRQLATGTCCCYSENCNKDMATCRSGSMILYRSLIVFVFIPFMTV